MADSFERLAQWHSKNFNEKRCIKLGEGVQFYAPFMAQLQAQCDDIFEYERHRYQMMVNYGRQIFPKTAAVINEFHAQVRRLTHD